MDIKGAYDIEQVSLKSGIEHELWPLEESDPKKARFPCCLVWTPLPVVSWLAPFMGHVGICREDGAILDFSGSNLVSHDNFAYGAAARYLQLDRDQEPWGSYMQARVYAHGEWECNHLGRCLTCQYTLLRDQDLQHFHLQLPFFCCELLESGLLPWINELEHVERGYLSSVKGSLDRLKISGEIFPAVRTGAVSGCVSGGLAFYNGALMFFPHSDWVATLDHAYMQFFVDLWRSMSRVVQLASASEATVSTCQVSIWRSLWNDLFSQVFRALSILNGFVAFFTACNRHRLGIYNHLTRSLGGAPRFHTSDSHYIRKPYESRSLVRVLSLPKLMDFSLFFFSGSRKLSTSADMGIHRTEHIFPSRKSRGEPSFVTKHDI